jgi:hypothetical protein
VVAFRALHLCAILLMGIPMFEIRRSFK